MQRYATKQLITNKIGAPSTEGSATAGLASVGLALSTVLGNLAHGKADDSENQS